MQPVANRDQSRGLFSVLVTEINKNSEIFVGCLLLILRCSPIGNADDFRSH